MRFVLTLAVVALFSYLLVGRAVDFEHARANVWIDSDNGTCTLSNGKRCLTPADLARAGMLSEGVAERSSGASGGQARLVGTPSESVQPTARGGDAYAPGNGPHVASGELYQGRNIRWWARRAVQARKDANARGRTIRRLKRELAAALQPPTEATWAEIQIRYANLIAVASAGDPWPNCPDPHDGSGASWHDTVRCENGGSWLDSPGYYRCGLQFDPMWERHYGRRFCP